MSFFNNLQLYCFFRSCKERICATISSRQDQKCQESDECFSASGSAGSSTKRGGAKNAENARRNTNKKYAPTKGPRTLVYRSSQAFKISANKLICA